MIRTPQISKTKTSTKTPNSNFPNNSTNTPSTSHKSQTKSLPRTNTSTPLPVIIKTPSGPIRHYPSINADQDPTPAEADGRESDWDGSMPSPILRSRSVAEVLSGSVSRLSADAGEGKLSHWRPNGSGSPFSGSGRRRMPKPQQIHTVNDSSSDDEITVNLNKPTRTPRQPPPPPYQAPPTPPYQAPPPPPKPITPKTAQVQQNYITKLQNIKPITLTNLKPNISTLQLCHVLSQHITNFNANQYSFTPKQNSYTIKPNTITAFNNIQKLVASIPDGLRADLGEMVSAQFAEIPPRAPARDRTVESYFVVKGVALELTPSHAELCATVRSQNAGILGISRMYNSKLNKFSTTLKIQTTNPNIANQYILKGITFNTLTFKCEAYIALPVVRQCYACLRWGNHNPQHCTNKPKCLRCGGEHSLQNCKTPKGQPHCHNCNKPGHMACHKSCSHYKLAMQYALKSATPQQHNPIFKHNKPQASQPPNTLSTQPRKTLFAHHPWYQSKTLTNNINQLSPQFLQTYYYKSPTATHTPKPKPTTTTTGTNTTTTQGTNTQAQPDDPFGFRELEQTSNQTAITLYILTHLMRSAGRVTLDSITSLASLLQIQLNYTINPIYTFNTFNLLKYPDGDLTSNNSTPT